MPNSPLMNEVGNVVGRLLTRFLKIDANGDGKVSQFEILQAVQVGIFELMTIFGKINEVKDAFEQVSQEEIASLADGFADQFEMNRKELEILIERYIMMGVNVTDLVGDTIRYRQQAAIERTLDDTSEE